MSEPLDSMKLPKRSIQEELEQLSRDKLRPLFSQELFLIREETVRDKGIDLSIELKYKNVHTNFRFIVQLKATQSKEANTDGSYSFQIDTSNIQYLLNGGLPAYYITYVKQNDCFYFENLQDFVNRICQNEKPWNQQDTHTPLIPFVSYTYFHNLDFKSIIIICAASTVLKFGMPRITPSLK